MGATAVVDEETQCVALPANSSSEPSTRCVFWAGRHRRVSGENILAFVSICREIWESWGRTQANSSLAGEVEGFAPFDRLRRTSESVKQVDSGVKKSLQAPGAILCSDQSTPSATSCISDS